MAKIPIILEPGRADGKLAISGSIFDENKCMFQSEINDIQDTLNSDNPNKPLSAKQGKVLKELLDTKVIEIGAVPIDTEPTEGNTTHVVTSDGIHKALAQKVNKTITFNECYNIEQGYSNADNVVELSTRVCTGFIDALYQDIPVISQEGAYLRYAEKFDANYNFVEQYIINGYSANLPKGFYYRINISKDLAGTADITPDDVVDKIKIGKIIDTYAKIEKIGQDTETAIVKSNYASYLRVGYQLDGDWNLDNTRVSLQYINVPLTQVVVSTKSPIVIAGVVTRNTDYTYNKYTSINSDKVVLEGGYIYSIIVRNEGSSVLGIDDVAPFIEIDFADTKNRLGLLESSMLSTVGKNYQLSEFEKDTYYIGTTIGDSLSKGSLQNCYAIKIPVTTDMKFRLTSHGGGSARAYYLLDSNEKIIELATEYFDGTTEIEITNNAHYLVAQTNNGQISLKLIGIESDIDNIKNNISGIELKLDFSLNCFKCCTPFVWAELSKLKMGDERFVNIGFIGDSWTQGTEDSVVSGKFEGYVKHLTKMLQDEYGYGGLGWVDFAKDGGDSYGTMFAGADMWEKMTASFTGTPTTGFDGSTSGHASKCLGICCAHTIFANGSILTLRFAKGSLDVFKLRYYKNAHFSVSINRGNAVDITANSTDAWQETQFGSVGTDTTEVVITSLTDNSVIFGMDCFYGTKGVRCHKIGNRSITAQQYLSMDANQWQGGISRLNLCWASVLLAINDIGQSQDELVIDAIVSRIEQLTERLKTACTYGDIVRADINILGVENIENANWFGLSALAKKEKEFAFANGYGWTSTDTCIGKNKKEFVYNGTFSDTIHLNKYGSYAYAKHIFNTLFVE